MLNINTTVTIALEFKLLLNLVLQLSQEHKALLISILQKDLQALPHATPALQIKNISNETATDITENLADAELLELIKKLG